MTYNHRIHGTIVYLHLVDFYGKLVGKYTSPMDPMGYGALSYVPLHDTRNYFLSIDPTRFGRFQVLWLGTEVK